MAEISWAAELPPIRVSNNSAWNEGFTVMDGETPRDLTGASLVMELRPRAEASTVALRFSTEEGGAYVANAESGEIQFYRSASLLARVPPGSYVRDILILQGEEEIYGGRGEVTIEQGITRR